MAGRLRAIRRARRSLRWRLSRLPPCPMVFPTNGPARHCREKRRQGQEIVAAAIEAARLRFRAVMMTSFAFIAGLVPLVIASGAGRATIRAVGTAVFGGMVTASFLGIFVIPGLYVLFQTLRERVKSLSKSRKPVIPERTIPEKAAE